MMQHHGYSLTELNDMVPWEREIHIALLQEHITEENERIKAENRRMGYWLRTKITAEMK